MSIQKVTHCVRYKIGERIKKDCGVFKVMGYEFVQGRGTRYILFTARNGTPEWTYLYDFEIKSLD